MGIFANLWKKHGHRKDKIIQELLAEIKLQEEKSILQEEKSILQEQNERRLIQENERIFKELQRCLHQPKEPKAFYLTARYQIS